jgi:hypothetical protein
MLKPQEDFELFLPSGLNTSLMNSREDSTRTGKMLRRRHSPSMLTDGSKMIRARTPSIEILTESRNTVMLSESLPAPK